MDADLEGAEGHEDARHEWGVRHERFYNVRARLTTGTLIFSHYSATVDLVCRTGTGTRWTWARPPPCRKALTQVPPRHGCGWECCCLQARCRGQACAGAAGYAEGAQAGAEWGFVRGALVSLLALPQGLAPAQLQAVRPCPACGSTLLAGSAPATALRCSGAEPARARGGGGGRGRRPGLPCCGGARRRAGRPRRPGSRAERRRLCTAGPAASAKGAAVAGPAG